MGINPVVAMQAAFVAIAARLVGGSFRIAESFNPKLQQKNVIADPQIVIKRELLICGLAWTFAMITNMAIAPMAARRKWNEKSLAFATTFLGTLLAETFGRFLAYRKALKSPDPPPKVTRITPPANKTVPTPPPAVAEHKPTVQPTPAWNTAWYTPTMPYSYGQNYYYGYTYPYSYY